MVVESRLNPVWFDGSDIPADARIERRSQLALSEGVSGTRILVDAHGSASASLKLEVRLCAQHVCGIRTPCLPATECSAQEFADSVAVDRVAEFAEAFDSELEEFPKPRAFWGGRKVWRAVWDDFRNWLQLGLEARERT